MYKKVKQLNTLIKILDHKYNSITSDYNVVSENYNVSNDLIMNIKNDIELNENSLSRLSSTQGDNFLQNHIMFQSYIKSLFVNLENELDENTRLEKRVEDLDMKRVAVKTKAKGYELLVDKYKNQDNDDKRTDNNKKMDELWLFRRHENE